MYMSFKKTILLLLILLITDFAYGQNITSRITIQSGGSIQFPFNSYTKLANGMNYTNWTRLQIYYLDTLNDGTLNGTSQWHLMVRANTGTIDGDGGNSLSLNKVEIEATSTAGNTAGKITLTNTDQAIITDGPNNTNTATVTISYYVGETNALLGESPDYYFVDLIFTLEQQ